LTYLAAFVLFFGLAIRRLGHLPFKNLPQWQKRDVEDILFLGVLGVILGGRVGYCLFYKPAYYLSNPLEILAVWQGGMSFHGGLLGVMLAMVWFARTRQRPFLQVMDFVAPCVPTGLRGRSRIALGHGVSRRRGFAAPSFTDLPDCA
jgi:phosphatidylglycerol:prolipoprotein diacylglycerol transferase